MRYDYFVDFIYGTSYAGGPATVNLISANSFSYDLMFRGYAWGSITMEILQWFTVEERAIVDLFNVKPIGTTVSYPAAYDNVNGLCVDFWYELVIADVYARTKNNMKVCVGSLMELIDAGEWVMPDCVYDDDFEAEFRDGFLQYNTGATQAWTWAGMNSINGGAMCA